MTIFKTFFHFIFYSKFKFFKPKKKKILIFDQAGTGLVKKYFSKNDIHILHTRKESLNLFVLIKNFIKRKFSSLDYFNSYIKLVDPKIIISVIDNSPIFYKLKKNSTQKKILIASTVRTPIHDFALFDLNKIETKRNNETSVDIIFSLNDAIGKKFQKFNVKKVITIGSFKSNYFNFDEKKNIEVLYISSWASLPANHKVTHDVNFQEFNKHQIKLIKNLSQYGKDHQIKVTILGKMKNDLAKDEFTFYKNIFYNNKWEFIESEKANSYQVVDRSKVVITLNSTLGYESFSRGNRTLFFDVRSTPQSLNPLKFGWPIRGIEKEGPFWTKENSYYHCKNMLNKLRKMNDTEWRNIHKKFQGLLMPRDKNNSIFKKKLSEFYNFQD
jgi:surface carbohydrate biosynthesis protein